MSGELGIGVSAPRTEDRRFITGRGRYVDDINLRSQQYAWFVRSPHPHAEVRGVDAADALKMPGVTAVLTGADMQADDIGSLPVAWGITSRDGSPAHEPAYPALATDRVRYVGNPVAVVVAESRTQARDAAEMVNVDYEELESVSSATAALEEGAPLIHEGAPGNMCFDWEWLPAAMAPDAKGDTDKAFQEAAHVVSLELVNNRLVPNAMEPRASLADFNPATGQLTLYTTSQNPHVNRLLLCTATLKMPEHKVRVVAPDVGGGFGSKIYHYAEELTVCWASRRLGVPVKWTAERSESFLADAQGRDHVTRVELALDAEARFTGMRVDTIANLGGWLSAFGPAIPTVFYAPLLAGVYKTPNIYVTVKGVFTNTTPTDAYRGAGRPEACYAVERAVDEAAVQIGMDPAELRRRNFIPPDEFPYQSPVGQLYDSGDFEGCLNLARELNAYERFDERRRESQARGKLRGRGMCFYIEACGAAPSQAAGQLGARAGLYEVATVRVHPSGSVQVLT
ncbi:MAG: xanthine dehydrogenase family protein molybdopterin-binding subunit, partial [Gammaproteobacteria bacterium]|nr:xanthine dehydrogenase family protein molybdopterin-binding subunit [Gammaproteobacteria bacterium]